MTSPRIKPPKLPVQFDNIPEEMRAHKRWVVWDWWYSEKQKKWTKPPLQSNGQRASSTDAATWTTYGLAFIVGRSRSGVGFVLGKDIGYVGIDLDNCRDPDTGVINEPAASIIRDLDTYAEVSPSGRGVKLLCKAALPDKCRKANHEIGLEMYCDGRYFTITGSVLPDNKRTIENRQAVVSQLIERWLAIDESANEIPNTSSPEDEIELARSALKALSPSRCDGYWDWLTVGMSLNSISTTLLDDWDQWSRQSPKYSAGACAEKWLSFGGSGVGPGTLYHFAKQDGWIAPKGWRKRGAKAAGVAEALIENYHRETVQFPDGSERMVKTAHPQKQIVDDILKQFNQWPKRVNDQLFICRNGSVEFLDKPSSLFSWMRDSCQVVWGTGDDLVTKEEIHYSLGRSSSVQCFIDVQEHPHFPPLPNVYYTCGTPERGSGQYLSQLLDCFSPSSDADRQLILAAIATTFWGGPPGQRPAFLISAVAGAGQGTGKSTLSSMIGKLTGGAVELSAGMDTEDIKKRLLSGGETTKRVVSLDNVKKTKFSDQGIEALITSPTISGHRMFFGSASRPNLLTWFITMNGPSLSRDLAQRCVNIVLKRPKHSGNWYETTTNFIEVHRERIIEDIAAFFQGSRGEISYPSRWGLWEREVLSRVDHPDKVATVLRSRETANDDDQQAANNIEEFVTARLKDLGLLSSVDTKRVHIPNDLIAKWVNHAIDEDEYASKRNAIALLNRLENSGQLVALAKNPTRTYGRGWVYSFGAMEDTRIFYRLNHHGIVENEPDELGRKDIF